MLGFIIFLLLLVTFSNVSAIENQSAFENNPFAKSVVGFQDISQRLGAYRILSEYSNPADTYVPGKNVENGNRITGEEFSASEEYATAVLSAPIALTVMGFLSIIGLNVALCCRKCFKCCRCDPNDHHNDKGHENDSATKRAAYINHQKLMVFIVEMVLCFCVFLADMLCYYGYGYIVSGGKDLLEAVDMFVDLLTEANVAALNIGSKYAPAMKGAVTLSRATCPSSWASGGGQSAVDAIDDAYTAMEDAADLTATAMTTVSEMLVSLIDMLADVKDYIDGYLMKYADVFVFLVWSFAVVSVLLFVIFRIFRSQCGTKFAIFWGQLTFILLLLVCLPFMIFSAAFGNFCMNPSKSAIENVEDADLKAKIQYYATCVGNSEIMDQFQTGIDEANAIPAKIVSEGFGTYSSGYCFDGATASGAPNPATAIDKLNAASGFAVAIAGALGQIMTAADCSNIQAIWFKIVNDALCTNFYSGIYSLWVSQFITSFFLFFLIVVASISYHYFAETKIYVAAPMEIDNGETQQHKEIIDQDIEMPPIHKNISDNENNNEITNEDEV